MSETVGEPSGLERAIAKAEVADAPNEAADPPALVQAHVPADILDKYEVHSYRNAALILAGAHRPEFDELLEALRRFRITTTMIRTAGGNESETPSSSASPCGRMDGMRRSFRAT